MNYRVFVITTIMILSFTSIFGQDLQSALDGLGYTIDVVSDRISGEIFFQKQASDASIIFQESSQLYIEAVGWYTGSDNGQWLIGGTETGLPRSASLPNLDGVFGFKFHPNYTGTGFIQGIWYSEAWRNDDGADHALIFPAKINGEVVPHSYLLCWEDLENLGDADFQDMIVQINGVDAVILNPMQWRIADGGNGHWYSVIPLDLFWEEAVQVANGYQIGDQNGYLATITGQAENDFITSQILPGVNNPSVLDQYWMGGELSENGWQWTTGETFDFSNWDGGEPSGDGPILGVWGLAITGENHTGDSREPGHWNDLPSDAYTFYALAEWGGSNSSLAGFVYNNSNCGVSNVRISIYNQFGQLSACTVTDGTGNYKFDPVSCGRYTVAIDPPLGFNPDQEVKDVNILSVPSSIDFKLLPLSTTGKVRDIWWWKTQLGYLRDKKSAEISKSGMDTYGIAIFNHFYDRIDGYGIQFNNVTFKDPESPRPMAFADFVETYLGPYDGSNESCARHALLANLLNIASVRQRQTDIVSEDGATAGQAITYFAGLIKTGNNKCCYDAFINLRKMHMSQKIASGVIPLTTPSIIYKEKAEVAVVPADFSLEQNYPNPFNPRTTILFDLPQASNVTIDIFNIVGQKVSTVLDGQLNAGNHRVEWDGRCDNGNEAASGIYFYRLRAREFVDTKKMTLLK